MTFAINLPRERTLQPEREKCRTNPFIVLNGTHVLETLRNAQEFISSYKIAARAASFTLRTVQAIPFQQFLSGRSDQTNLEFLNQSDVEVVPDNMQNYGIRQILSSDALYFIDLYHAITQDKTCLKVIGSQEYKEKVFKEFQILLTRPSGRQLIGTLCSLGKEVLIQDQNRTNFTWENGVAHISFCYNLCEGAISQCQDTRRGEYHFQLTPSYMLLAHEFIHVLHNDAQISAPNSLPSFMDLKKESADPHKFNNLNEQFAIVGLSEYGSIPCENRLRAEFGLMPRISHYCSEYLCYKPADLSSIDQPNERNISRIENAVSFRDYRQIRKLLAAGANPACGFLQAIFKGDRKIVEFLLNQGANPNLPADNGWRPLHYAIWYDQRDLLTLLIDRGCEIDSTVGQTPLEYALQEKKFECALLLLKRGARLTEDMISLLPREPEIFERFLDYLDPFEGDAEEEYAAPTLVEIQNTSTAMLLNKKRAMSTGPVQENHEEPPPKRAALTDLETGLPCAAVRTYNKQ